MLDLEWFGPPERNTLRPLCDVLPLPRESLRELGAESSVRLCVLERAFSVQRAPPLYISREAHTWPLGPRQMDPTVTPRVFAQ